MIGPWCVKRITIVVSLPSFNGIVSSKISMSRQLSPLLYFVWSSSFSVSTKKSTSSTILFVNPHAQFSFWPITGTGIPAMHTPLTLNLPPFRCISYHLAGWENCKCGSFAKSGFPVFVLSPERTQLFDPISEDLN